MFQSSVAFNLLSAEIPCLCRQVSLAGASGHLGAATSFQVPLRIHGIIVSAYVAGSFALMFSLYRYPKPYIYSSVFLSSFLCIEGRSDAVFGFGTCSFYLGYPLQQVTPQYFPRNEARWKLTYSFCPCASTCARSPIVQVLCQVRRPPFPLTSRRALTIPSWSRSRHDSTRHSSRCAEQSAGLVDRVRLFFVRILVFSSVSDPALASFAELSTPRSRSTIVGSRESPSSARSVIRSGTASSRSVFSFPGGLDALLTSWFGAFCEQAWAGARYLRQVFSQPYWNWGVAAAAGGFVLVFASTRWLRQLSYEAFLIGHIAGALLWVVGWSVPYRGNSSSLFY